MTDTSVAGSDAPLVVTDEASAVERFHNLLHPQESEEPPAEKEAEGTDDAEAPKEAQEASPEPDTDDSESEAESEESVEVPSTFNDLADQFGVDVNELASHLTVKVNGEEVSLADLRDGHMRRADFTRRMQEVADERKALHAERQRLEGNLSQRLQQIDTLANMLQQQIQPQDDLARLLDEDPAEYVRAKARLEAQQQALFYAQQVRQQQLQEQTAKQKEEARRFRQEQQKLLTKAIPNLDKAENQTAFQEEITGYLQTLDFTPEEIGNFFDSPWDHRQIVIIQNAAKYAKLKEGEAKLKKKVKALPRVQKPGSAEDKQSRSRDARTVARDRLKRGGTDKEAREYFKAILS